jgi:rhamnulokinase
MPEDPPERPGRIVGRLESTVDLVSVGSHDTASAVFGLGNLRDDQAFLNVGTWSLLGCMSDSPIVTRDAEVAGFSNERAVDGRIRFLTNIPGFYVINRLHEELDVRIPVSDWLANSRESTAAVDLFDGRFFNPESMICAICEVLGYEFSGDWAGLALASLVESIGTKLRELERIVGRSFSELRVTGGGSQSEKLCLELARRTKIPLVVGPSEATIYGNLGVQLFATGAVESLSEAGDVVRNSYSTTLYCA